MWGEKLLGRAWLLRALVTELRGIRLQLTRQADLLERWSLAAGVPSASAAQTQDLTETGITFLDATEQHLAEAYIARTTLDTGQPPSDDQILHYLSDEKTTSLAARLREREDLLRDKAGVDR